MCDSERTSIMLICRLRLDAVDDNVIFRDATSDVTSLRDAKAFCSHLQPMIGSEGMVVIQMTDNPIIVLLITVAHNVTLT